MKHAVSHAASLWPVAFLLSVWIAYEQSKRGEEYEGKARGETKTSIGTGKPEHFPTIGSLLTAISKPEYSDKAMRARLNSKSSRCDFEQRNVVIEDAWLHCMKREADNDFHLIVGEQGGGPYMTCEVTGLPKDPPEALTSVRTYLEDYFAEHLPGSQYVDYSQAPLHLTISGSLFFDVDHGVGVVGHGKVFPRTVWEIHPVTALEFKEQ